MTKECEQINLEKNNSLVYQHSKRNFNSEILQCIGNTPLIKLDKILRHYNISKDISIYAKAEWFNPGGSVKDRPALKMIEDGEKRGRLNHKKIILDSTSGNTGIAYALIGAVKGYKVKLVVPENVTLERKKILKAYGAEIVFSDPLQSSDGAQKEAIRIYNKEPEKYFMPCQYNNPANPLAHFETTGVEIWEQTQGEVTHFIAGIGTSGTLMGTGRRLKLFNPQIKIYAAEPQEALHGLEGLKNMSVSIVPAIYKEKELDGKIKIPTEESLTIADTLAKIEGLLVGHSAGGALYACFKLAQQIKKGTIVTVFPDGGDRYLSTT